MQTLLPNMTGAGSRGHNRLGFGALAVLILSLGIGATTAAFSAIDGLLPHSAPYQSCDIGAAHAGDPGMVVVNVPHDEPELRDRATDAYEASMDAVGDGLGSWVDAAGGVADGALLVLLSAAALALLVACSNAARTLYERSGCAVRRSGTARIALATGGAIALAAMLLRLTSTSALANVLGSMPTARLDVRAIAFALCVSALVEARRRIHPRLT